jgi:hypothetical protein
VELASSICTKIESDDVRFIVAPRMDVGPTRSWHSPAPPHPTVSQRPLRLQVRCIVSRYTTRTSRFSVSVSVSVSLSVSLSLSLCLSLCLCLSLSLTLSLSLSLSLTQSLSLTLSLSLSRLGTHQVVIRALGCCRQRNGGGGALCGECVAARGGGRRRWHVREHQQQHQRRQHPQRHLRPAEWMSGPRSISAWRVEEGLYRIGK